MLCLSTATGTHGILSNLVVGKHGAKVVGRRLSLRTEGETMCYLEKWVHRHALGEVGASAIEHKVGQLRS